MTDALWRVASCGCCAGIKWGGDYPRECRQCGGEGAVFIRPSGHVALYPGGPWCGMWSRTRYEQATPYRIEPEECGKAARGAL